MAEPEFKTYLCEYPFDGSRWCFEIKAASFEDADARLRALPFAKVSGECMAKVPVPFGNTLRRWFFGGRRG